MKAPVKSSASSSRADSIRKTNGAPAAAGPALFALLAEHHHEQVSFFSEPSCGYRGIIAVHDTTLGPALGGTRFWNYASDAEALVDALRLARGMTYKAAWRASTWAAGKA